ncbi:MAG TPA: ABC transporter substrate-binding protein, partial [Jatrophihabitans sp.]
MSPRVAIGAVSLLRAAVVLAGCGSSNNDNKGSGSGSGNAGKGPITFVTGKDNSGLMPHLAEAWNKDHPNEKVTIKQQSDQADQQLSDLQQHFQAKDPNYDVVTVDVVWTAEFAAKGWLVPLKDKNAMDTSKLLEPTVKAATYNGTLYAAPYASDAGLLYYRKDIVGKAPTTWDEMINACKGKTSPTITGPKPACYAGQFAKYEGLTVNASEAINSAGGQIVKEDGKTPNLETPEAAKGLEFLVNGFKQGYIPKEALGFQETQSLNAFQAGQLLFMRNWPYADAILSGSGSKVAGKYDIAPLPGPDGPGASSLGGHSVALSAYSKNQGTGLEFLKFIQTQEVQSYNLTQGSNAPVLAALYDDPALAKKFPYLPVLKKGIENAIPRPVTPFYPAVTEAIS